ncbi:MAG: site-2 protease family protein [Opitutaceae bacterium]|nr:site-2 protease family protein [Opitutaceae bacterium]MBP9912309.1 site-2 protease family protein [Opitutaceae bacterium]
MFRIRGIQLAVHASFFLLLAYVGWDGWSDAQLAGLSWSLVTITAFFACVVLHELGHSFVAMHYGVGVRRILLMPIGGMAEMDNIPRQPARELLITLAGPAVNFVLAAGLWLVVRTYAEDVRLYSFDGLIYQLFIANLVMGCFNLVPVFPMDGGRIFRALLATRLPYLRATFWAASVGKVLSVVGILVMLFWFKPPHYLGGLLFLFIYMAGDTEYKAVRRQELDAAHWRTVFARLHPVPSTEPPLLKRPGQTDP